MRVIDLSQTIQSGMEIYPDDPEVEIEVVQQRSEEGWELRRLTMGSHTGTHVDAFSHMHESGANLDGIPVERFVGDAWCVTLEQDLPDGVGLIFAEHIGESMTDRILAASPPFVGGPSLDEELERRLLGKDVITYDGLVNLDQLPTDRSFTFVGLPLKIRSGDGSPVRAIAIL